MALLAKGIEHVRTLWQPAYDPELRQPNVCDHYGHVPVGKLPTPEALISSHISASKDPLLSLALESLRRGHRKVALRRLLMHMARGASIDSSEQGLVAALSARCTERELAKMRGDAAEWAKMLGVVEHDSRWGQWAPPKRRLKEQHAN